MNSLTTCLTAVQLVISKYELNTQMVEGKSVDDYAPTGQAGSFVC